MACVMLQVGLIFYKYKNECLYDINVLKKNKKNLRI